mgnify:FL=1
MGKPGVQWGKVVLGAGVAMLVVAALVGAYSAGRQGDVRPTVQPVAAMAVAPVAAPMALVPTAAPVRVEPATPSDAQLAASLAALSGEALVGRLWEIEAASNPNVTYAMLMRNAARQAGQIAVFAGRVLEIQDLPDGGSFVRLGLGGERVLAVFTYVEPAADLVQGRRVRAYGTLAGTFEYTSQAGWNITIPRMNAVAVVSDGVPRRAARAPR